jgi:hypothetical protein
MKLIWIVSPNHAPPYSSLSSIATMLERLADLE